MPGIPLSVFWFRRDLRLDDNAGLYHALLSGNPLLPIFIFDTNILDSLEQKKDKRVHFIHRALADLHDQLQQIGSTLYVMHGTPVECFSKLTYEYNIAAVYT